MTVEIITEKLQFDIYGFGAIAANKDYAATAFKLSGKMWDIVKANGIKNEGMNIWVYENDHQVFAGIKLNDPSGSNDFGLEKMTININKYAYYKHIGPYHLIGQAGQYMKRELAQKGYVVVLPYIEIYGHWNADETKTVTQLFMCLE